MNATLSPCSSLPLLASAALAIRDQRLVAYSSGRELTEDEILAGAEEELEQAELAPQGRPISDEEEAIALAI